MNGLRRSFYYISLFFDIMVLFVSFAAADLVSRSRLPERVLEGIGEAGAFEASVSM